jgi:hypothetical protein
LSITILLVSMTYSLRDQAVIRGSRYDHATDMNILRLRQLASYILVDVIISDRQFFPHSLAEPVGPKVVLRYVCFST